MSTREKAFNAYFKSTASITDLSPLDIFYEGWKAAKKESEITLKITVDVDEIAELIKRELARHGL